MTDKIKLVCSCGTINQLSPERLDQSPKCGICRSSLFSGAPIPVDSHRLIKHVENTGIPVVVDFWAPWCGPCVNFAPTYAKFAESVGSQLRVLKIDTEANQQTGIDFNIRSIPTLAVFLNGEERGRMSGAMQLPQLQQWVLQQLTDD